jgi:hypothetical protein
VFLQLGNSKVCVHGVDSHCGSAGACMDDTLMAFVVYLISGSMQPAVQAVAVSLHCMWLLSE